MESYHKRKRILEEKYGKLIYLKPLNDERVVIASNRQQKLLKQLRDISDEEGLKRAYDTKDGLYQHYNKLFIAGTKDFPQDHIDDLKLPFDDTLNKTKEVEMPMLIIEVTMKLIQSWVIVLEGQYLYP